MTWIGDTLGGVHAMAASGYAWGALMDGGRLASVACSFFIGERYEDIGVATLTAYRGRGRPAP